MFPLRQEAEEHFGVRHTRDSGVEKCPITWQRSFPMKTIVSVNSVEEAKFPPEIVIFVPPSIPPNLRKYVSEEKLGLAKLTMD
jgi:hypothetical protein